MSNPPSSSEESTYDPATNSESSQSDEFTIRSILWTVYVPTFLLSLGQGLVLAQVPLLAKDLGAGFGLIGVAVAAREIGTMIFDVPSGVMVSRFGSKRTMVAGTAAIGAAAIGAGLATSIAMFIVLRFAQGAFTAMWSYPGRLTSQRSSRSKNAGDLLPSLAESTASP